MFTCLLLYFPQRLLVIICWSSPWKHVNKNYSHATLPVNIDQQFCPLILLWSFSRSIDCKRWKKMVLRDKVGRMVEQAICWLTYGWHHVHWPTLCTLPGPLSNHAGPSPSYSPPSVVAMQRSMEAAILLPADIGQSTCVADRHPWSMSLAIHLASPLSSSKLITHSSLPR